jgi:hypothetical protein
MKAASVDLQYRNLVAKLQQHERPQIEKGYALETDGLLLYKNRVYVPNVRELKLAILKEMHNVAYVGHPGYQKTVVAVKSHYFWPSMKKIHYLGHIISEEGIIVDLEKVKAIQEWPALRNVTEVRSFMGLAGYYRRFIAGFSRIAHAITSLQRKEKKFQWTEQCESSFQQLKQLLTSAPILKIVDPSKDYVVCTDVCKEGLGEFSAKRDL